jgi:four helix bundle protein
MTGNEPFVFFHERLDVYRVSLEFLRHVHGLISDLGRGHGNWCDQMRRAGISISANIAEAACERAGPEKRRMFLIALRSANECAALLDSLSILLPSESPRCQAARSVLARVVAMLAKLGRVGRGA